MYDRFLLDELVNAIFTVYLGSGKILVPVNVMGFGAKLGATCLSYDDTIIAIVIHSHSIINHRTTIVIVSSTHHSDTIIAIAIDGFSYFAILATGRELFCELPRRTDTL